MDQTPDIIYEDTWIIVCRKEAGIPVQTAKAGQQDMVSLLKNYRMNQGETPEIFLVHRLDQPVEGILLLAKNQKAASDLSRQIQQKSVGKYYKAVVDGVLHPKEGILNNWLLKDAKANMSKVVTADTKGAKKASLSYRALECVQGKTLAEICLETGRHHQIRVQMAHAGYPLVGDKKYNPNCRSGYFPIGLCSAELKFKHPKNGEMMVFQMEPKGEAFGIFNLYMKK